MVSESRVGREPKTLMQAHELLSHIRPSKGASRTTWLAYYRQSAAVYAEIAEIDRGHHHEALYWANRERGKARDLQTAIARNPEPPEVEKPKESAPSTTVQNKQ